MSSAKGKGKAIDHSSSNSIKAGLQFPVGRIGRFLRHGRYSQRVGMQAPVYMAAVLEYLAAELLELSGNMAAEMNKNRIGPRHILLAMKNDDELNLFMENATIADGGVLPRIEDELIPSRSKAKAEASQKV